MCAVPRCARNHDINIPLQKQTAVALAPELTGWPVASLGAFGARRVAWGIRAEVDIKLLWRLNGSLPQRACDRQGELTVYHLTSLPVRRMA